MATNMKIFCFLFFLARSPTIDQSEQSTSHQQYHKLLQKNVSSDGRVNYPGFIRDSLELNQYLKTLAVQSAGRKILDKK